MIIRSNVFILQEEDSALLPPIPVIPQDFSQKGPFRCLLCDDIPPIGQTSYDFHKHLCEAHFRDRLLLAIRQIEVKEGEVTVKKYACPAPNCGYELPQKWVMAKHYGLKHQIAKQFYATICDLSSLPPSQLVIQVTESLLFVKRNYYYANLAVYRGKMKTLVMLSATLMTLTKTRL